MIRDSEKSQHSIQIIEFWKRTGLKRPNLNLIFWSSAVSLFFSDQFYNKMSKNLRTQSQIPVRLSSEFPFSARKWLLCVGQHSLCDWCKTPKCQDTNWDKIHGGLGAFAIASDSIKHGPPSGREKKAESFPEPSKKQTGESGEDPCEGSVFGPLWSVAKMPSFFRGLNHSLGASRLEPRTKNVLVRSQQKTFPLFQKTGVHLEIENKQRLPQEKTHHLTPRNMNNLCQSVSAPFKIGGESWRSRLVDAWWKFN